MKPAPPVTKYRMRFTDLHRVAELTELRDDWASSAHLKPAARKAWHTPPDVARRPHVFRRERDSQTAAASCNVWSMVLGVARRQRATDCGRGRCHARSNGARAGAATQQARRAGRVFVLVSRGRRQW